MIRNVTIITLFLTFLMITGCFLLGATFDEELMNFEKGGYQTSVYNRKLSTYINSLSNAGFVIENIVEETDKATFESECEFSSRYYSPYKAKKFPLSFIIKARKL